MTFLFCSRSCSSCASRCYPALLIATSTRLFFCLKCPNRAAASLWDALVKCSRSLPFFFLPRLFILSQRLTPSFDQLVSVLSDPAPSPNKLQQSSMLYLVRDCILNKEMCPTISHWMNSAWISKSRYCTGNFQELAGKVLWISRNFSVAHSAGFLFAQLGHCS